MQMFAPAAARDLKQSETAANVLIFNTGMLCLLSAHHRMCLLLQWLKDVYYSIATLNILGCMSVLQCMCAVAVAQELAAQYRNIGHSG